MKRFSAFSDDQARQLFKARLHDVRRIIMVVSLLVVALALGFGYGLNKVSDASEDADAANRAVAALNKQRSLEASVAAKAAIRNGREAAVSAYTTCRRQQESTQAQRIAVHILLADPDPHVHHLAVHYFDFLNAQHLLDVPDCPKPPKGTG